MPEGEPTRREWLGYWSMIVQQTQNAFNDKAAQFILIPLGGLVGFSVESAAGLMIALPFVLFAPLAGWLSDRFSKRDVIVGAAITQVAILSLICLAIYGKSMPLALVGFFLLAVQSAFFSPAKIGINKELVGSKHLGFAAGVQQMMAMLAILGGQIVAGWWFDKRYVSMGAVTERAWDAELFPLLLLTCFSVPAVIMAIIIPRVPAQGREEKITPRLMISHFKDLRELWSEPSMRRASFGVAFFWGFAAFINLWSVKVAKSLTDGGEGFGTLSSIFMAAASLGMVAGFGFASWLLRKKIELGWVPLAGVGMTACALVLVTLTPAGWPFLIMLGLLAFSSALFLAPLNAWMQDNYPPARRGELQSAVNLQDCFAGIIAVIGIELMILLARLLGIGEIAGFRLQLIVIGLTCGLMTWFIIRLLPVDFLRLICLGAIRTLYRIRFTGTERIPAEGGALLLPNHVTFADAFFISATSERPVRFVMDEGFMAHAGVRFSARLFGTVTIRRDQPLEAIRSTIKALEDGHLVALFPEGQLTRSGALCELERGFELIARKTRAPILPLWVDGSWGSIFSFERGRFFRKIPYRIPYGLAIAVGEPLAPEQINRAGVRSALMKISAEAVARRFEGKSGPLKINAHQLTQLEALRRGQTVSVLKQDSAFSEIAEVLGGFARQTNSGIVETDTFDPAAGDAWLGGLELRERIESGRPPEREIRFYDFSPRAIEPMAVEGVLHLPCLAIGGKVVSMSAPHPQMPEEDKLVQTGHKPGSWGKLLPGWYVEDGRIFPGGLPLPPGTSPDGEGFLVRE